MIWDEKELAKQTVGRKDNCKQSEQDMQRIWHGWRFAGSRNWKEVQKTEKLV